MRLVLSLSRHTLQSASNTMRQSAIVIASSSSSSTQHRAYQTAAATTQQSSAAPTLFHQQDRHAAARSSSGKVVIGGDFGAMVMGRNSNTKKNYYTTHSQLPSEHQMVYEMCRKFADEELTPNAGKWDKEHAFPVEAVNKLVRKVLLFPLLLFDLFLMNK